MARRRSGKKIDFVHWINASGLVAGQAAGTNGFTLLAAQHLSETLLRIRGNLVCWADASLAPGVNVHVGVGMILVPEGTGTTVLWSPIADGDAPWIWYDTFLVGYEEPVIDAIQVVTLSGYRSIIDNKAMRIVRNQEVQFVLEQATVQGAMPVNAFIAARFLAGT